MNAKFNFNQGYQFSQGDYDSTQKATRKEIVNFIKVSVEKTIDMDSLAYWVGRLAGEIEK